MQQILMVVILAFGIGGAASEAQVGKNETVLNPNRAGSAELLALPQLDSALVAGIVERRPFAGMVAFDAYLDSTLADSAKTELYVGLFLPIDLNSAGDAEMHLVPGVGKRMAHEFEEYRPYKNMVQWRREIDKYVDDDELARLERYVFVPLELNSASEADILTIPGVGKRMAHEFEEYRPYKNMAQWRREIGKYVDDDELARLERYVFVKGE
jgi:DNA uptake protein ComE-like DNA-binding protein